jgi:hypothetical protein
MRLATIPAVAALRHMSPDMLQIPDTIENFAAIERHAGRQSTHWATNT